jgi:hypothetical protein
MPTADSIAVDSIPSFKPEPERAYSRTVTRVINGGFALKSSFSSLKAKSSSSSNCPHANPYPKNSVFVVFSSQQLILFRIPTQCSALARLRVREEFVAS